jgi:predicted  nucleic acid-binding Zn-ribbon protein
MSSTDIEKKSLEAHVELCAERYTALEKTYKVLESKLENLDSKVGKMDSNINAIRETLAGSGDKQSKQLIAIGTAIISVLITGIITLTIHFINSR